MHWSYNSTFPKQLCVKVNTIIRKLFYSEEIEFNDGFPAYFISDHTF